MALWWIAGGGALGAVLRYLVSAGLQRWSGGTFPVGTLVVNVAGCLAIGLLGGLFAGPILVRPEVRLGLLVGLLGGFTTFSSFGWETVQMLEEGRLMGVLSNVVLANALGLAAAWLGYRWATLWPGS